LLPFFFAGLDLKSGLMNLCQCRAPSSFLLQVWGKSGTNTTYSHGHGPRIDPNTCFDQQTIQLGPGDYLLGYTDGVTEAFNEQQDMYGESRLRTEVEKYSNQNPAKFLEAIFRSVTGWSTDPEICDDITLLIAHRL